MNSVVHPDNDLSNLAEGTDYYHPEQSVGQSDSISMVSGIEIIPVALQDVSKPYRIIIKGDLVNGSGTYSES